MSATEFGFNVIGHVSGNLGLGVSARNLIQVLLDNQFAVAALDIDPGLDRGRKDLRFERLTVRSVEELPYAVNLLIFPPSTLAKFVPQHRDLLFQPNRLNAAIIWWELPVVPPHWRATLEFFDVLLAPSQFIRHTLDVGLSETMTIAATQPVFLPPGIVSDRRRFGIAADEVVFVNSFEPSSDVMRKNVMAAVEAFEHGLADVPQARLIVRLNNARSALAGHPVNKALSEASARDARIRILADPLSYVEVLTLYASCDVFLSLHHSEGLGLGPLEAMLLGKPAIATAWSGNMTYMDHCNSCLVGYRLVPVAGSIAFYTRKFLGAEALWADPDVEHAAAWMRRLAQDATLRESIGRRAQASVVAFVQRAQQASFARELHELWQNRSRFPRRSHSDRELGRIHDQIFRHSASPGQIMARKGRQLLDRHLLWRFRRP